MLARRAKDEMNAARHIAERLDKPALAIVLRRCWLLLACHKVVGKVEPYVSGRTIQQVHRGELVYFRFFWTRAYPNILEPKQLNSKSSKASALKQLNPFRRFFQTDF